MSYDILSDYMPRKGAKGKWNLKMKPDEWYKKPDPWGVYFNTEEENKCSFICSLIDYGGFGIDVGCGEGWFTESYANIKKFLGIDTSFIAIGRAKGRVHKAKYLVGDIRMEGYKLDVDTVVLSEVLYYIHPDYWKTVSNNIKNMLKKKGQFIISVGQYFTESDIKKIFPWCEFDQVYKLPSKKYEYNLIMSGRK